MKAIKKRLRPLEAARDFQAYMEPVYRMYANIHMVSMPSILVHPDGHVEYQHSQWTASMLAECDKVAEQVKDGFPWEEYGLEKP